MAEHPHSHSHRHSSRCRKTLPFPELASRLRRGARKLTGPRQAILDLLRQKNHPLAVRDIHAALSDGCNLATVYRALNLLESMGMVKRYEFGDGVARFELLAEGDDGHHHHLICQRCSRVVELEECLVHELEQEVGRRHGFRGITHKLEFFGLCPECQKK